VFQDVSSMRVAGVWVWASVGRLREGHRCDREGGFD